MSIWSDTLALAKAGYKASEIKKLLEEKEVEEKEVEEKEVEEKEVEEKEVEEKEVEEKEVVNWEEKYKEIETKLKTLQNQNSKEELSDNTKSVEETATDILAELIGGKING